jgi:hypothetical protein
MAEQSMERLARAINLHLSGERREYELILAVLRASGIGEVAEAADKLVRAPAGCDVTDELPALERALARWEQWQKERP